MDERYETYYEDPMTAAKGQNKRPAASDNCYRNLNELHLNEVHVESESDLYVNGGGPYERLHLDSNGGEHCRDVYAQLHPASERETEKQCQCFSCKGNATKAVFVTFLMVVVILVIVTVTTTALVFVISLRNNLKAVGEEQNKFKTTVGEELNKFKTTVGEELNKIEARLGELNTQVMSNITQLENELERFQPLLYPPSFNVYEHCQKEMGRSTCVNDFSSSSVWTCSSQHLQMNRTVSSLKETILT